MSQTAVDLSQAPGVKPAVGRLSEKAARPKPAARDYERFTEDQLYRAARDLDIPGRSFMERPALIEALRKARR